MFYLPRRWEKFGINIYWYFIDMNCVRLENGEKLQYLGKTKPLKYIAFRQNRIPCYTRTQDQKTEIISTLLQKFNKIFQGGTVSQ